MTDCADIDWVAVFAACYRCKVGRPLEGDGDLCGRAYRSEPVKYVGVKTAADERAVRDTMGGLCD